MVSSFAPDETRGPLAGVRMILRYSWPLYLAGVGTAAVGATVAASRAHPRIRAAGAAGALGAGWLAVASLAASWWVYDRSELYRWTWLARAVPTPPDRVLVVHAGLDEASAPVRAMWPTAHVQSIDVHGGIGPTTASLRRARVEAAPVADPTHSRPAAADVAVAFLSAHEIRSAQGRTDLLAEISDRLRPGGRLVLCEHVRDLPNVLAYGPAVVHFYPPGEWRRAVTAAGMKLLTEERITPFVVLISAEKCSGRRTGRGDCA